MKIGLLSDIHSNSLALEQVLSELRCRDVDLILCAGDLIGYYTHPNRVIRLLRIAECDSVLGNHDYGALNGTPSDFNILAKRALDWNRRQLTERSRVYLEQVPETRRMTYDGLDIFIAHGSPKNPITGYIYEDEIDSGFLPFSFDIIPDIVILGQTHKPYIRQISGSLMINPGSVGQPRDGDPRASCAVVDTNDFSAEIIRVDYDQREMAEEVVEHLPKRLADRLLSGR